MTRVFKLATPKRRVWGAVPSRLTPLKGSAKDMEKYLGNVVSGGDNVLEDYVTGDAIVPTTWVGGGGAAEGLAGRPMEGEVQGLVDGRDVGRLSDEDADLVVSEQRKVHGWDVSFNAPKSYSVLLAAVSPEMRSLMLRAQTMAVTAAVAELDQSIGTRRGRGGLGEWQPAPGMLGAQTTHLTSREDDPQLHTHLTITNRVEAADGKVLTLDSKMLHDAFPTCVTTYGRELRRLTAEVLGIDWEGPDHEGHWRVAGVPQLACDEFSKRTRQIEEYRKKYPRVSEDWAARMTRSAKGKVEPFVAGLSDAPLSSGEYVRLFLSLFVAPHSADDSVGEVAFVGSSGFASGLAFAGFAGEVGGCLGLLSGLGDRGDVEHAVDAPVASEVEPVLDGVA